MRFLLVLAFLFVTPTQAQTLLVPDRVFDGDVMHDGWAVLVKGDRIAAVGSEAELASEARIRIDLAGTTLLPGLIEGHAHVLLHP